MKLALFFYSFSILNPHADMPIDKNYIKISQNFFYAVRTGDSNDHYIQMLHMADENELYQQLSPDSYKKAFWVNLYNAFVQKFLSQNPEKYKSRNAFFSEKQIIIAGEKLSLDDIEHGILRRSKIKWSLGYLNKLSPSEFERKFRVNSLDNRIHFALNCGAKSCPPIAYYDPEKIDAQLELAVGSYLKSEVDYDRNSGLVSLPRAMSWFRADFGGKKGIRRFLAKNKIVEADADTKIRFKKYDWGLYLKNYRTETDQTF